MPEFTCETGRQDYEGPRLPACLAVVPVVHVEGFRVGSCEVLDQNPNVVQEDRLTMLHEWENSERHKCDIRCHSLTDIILLSSRGNKFFFYGIIFSV